MKLNEVYHLIIYCRRIKQAYTGYSRFSTGEFFRATRPFSFVGISLITPARRGKMDADKGKRSLRVKKFASGKPA
jgi:hypothetical protein